MAGQNIPLHRRTVRALGLPYESAILITSVERNSPAQRAGLRDGDILTGFAGEAISDMDALHRLLTEKKVGVRSPVTVIRRSEKVTLDIVPEERSQAD